MPKVAFGKRFGLVAGIAALGIFALYWNYTVYEKKGVLLEIAKPFSEACQTTDGCISAPDGWEKDLQPGWFYKREPAYGMQYSAKDNGFEIHWHIATDVWLVAKGGKGKKTNVERVVE
jgi:hypothetical protein